WVPARVHAKAPLARIGGCANLARTPNRAELRGHALKTQSGAGLVSLFFGKQGALRGRGFDDQFRSFSCLGVLHNAVVAWNIIQVGRLVESAAASRSRSVRRRAWSPSFSTRARSVPIMRSSTSSASSRAVASNTRAKDT